MELLEDPVSNLVLTQRTGPSMNKGRSKQDYGTPRDFLDAVERRFGKIAVDLAAHAGNKVCERFIDPDTNSFLVDWSALTGLLWLNPPFSDISPWAEKCSREAGPRNPIVLLTPASISTNWFAEHVNRKAMVLGVNPRLTFVGTSDPYPKDLMLSCFGFGVSGFDCWRWK